ncbi:MAG TPA: hypothetical protein VFK20_06700 [Vicinamibacterales bacterium]|nr:hypothetical protein [Vicinamibacterales bacterium]
MRSTRFDALFLAAATALSCAWYVPRLGFYSDDWAFLGRYATAADQTVAGLFAASYSSHHAMRPVQLWLCAALYRTFGLEPLGYHLFNTAILLSLPILVYVILRELQLPRSIALSAALVYGLLPSYSTDRFWFVAFAITLSMAACLAGMLADIKAVAGRPVWWKALSVAAFAVSALAYEVALPLILLSAVLLIWRARQMRSAGRPVSTRWVAALVAIDLAILAGAAAFKLHTTVRLGADHGIAAQMRQIARQALDPHLPYGHYGLNVFSAARVHFVDAGIGLPAIAAALAPALPFGAWFLNAALWVLAFAYLAAAFRSERWPSADEWAALMPAGLIVFGLGYAIFLTNYNVQFTPTGIANRSAIAAALGAALCMAGAAGVAIRSLLPRRPGVFVLAGMIASFAACGSLVVNAIAASWANAYEMERRTLNDIRARLPTLPQGSTLILDGVCPYVGPAIVFESNWDLAGALQVLYRDPTIAADVVTPRLTISNEGLTTTIYGEARQYPYGDRLLVFEAGTGQVIPLPDAASGRQWFARRHTGCPPGQEGIGVRLF